MSRKASHKIPRPIATKIGAMRRAVIRFFAVDGLNRVLLCLFAICALDFAIDRAFRMDKAQRGIMLVLAICVLLYVLWKYLLRPLFSRLSDDALLLQVEESQGGLDETLISALELSRMEIGEDENVSQGMVQQTIERGAAAGAKIDLAKVFRFRKQRANGMILGVLMFGLIAAAGAIALTAPMSTWFNRNVLLGDAQWPQDYFLDVSGVEDGVLRVPRGDDWTISASVREGYRSLPERVDIEFKTGAGKRTESMVPTADGAGFRGEFRNVLDPFQFRLSSKEAETPWVQVELVDRPKIEGLVLAAEDPDYTGAGSRELPAGAGPYYLLTGSSIKVEGSADKDLDKATLVLGEKRFPLSVEGGSFSGSVEAGAVEAGTYYLEIEDKERMAIPGRDGLVGLGPRDPSRFKVRIKNDRKPRINVALFGVGGMVVPGAKLPFTGSVEDDFSVSEVTLGFDWKQDNSEGDPVGGAIALGEQASGVGEPLVALDGAVELAELEIPVNSRLSLQFGALDNDTVSGPKSGESTKILLRVVGEAELRTDLLRREKEQRQVLAELVKKQDQLLTDTGALAAECRDIEQLNPSQRERVVGLQKRQKLMGTNLRPLVARLEGIVQEIVNNRLEEEDGVLKARLNEKVIQPMISVQENIISAAAVELDAARRESDSVLRAEAFAAAGVAQRAAIDAMREILVHMVRNEGYQQAVNLLYEIQRAQERMRQMTDKAKESALGEVLEDKGAAEEKNEDSGKKPGGQTSPKEGAPPSVEGDDEKEAGGAPRS